MASASGITGKNAYIAFGGTVLHTNYRTLGFEDTIGTVDQSAGADDGITKLTLLRDGAFTLAVKRPLGGTTNWETLVPGQEGTLEVGPEGTATNKAKATVNVILTSKAVPLTYNDIVIDTYTFEHDDATGVVWSNY